MVKRLIRHIRRKPKAVRDQYALWIAISFTSAVALVWLFTLPSAPSVAVEINDETVIPQKQGSIGDIVGELRDEIGNLSSAVQSISTSSASSTTVASTSAPVWTNPSVAPAVRIATFTATSAPARP